MDECVSMSTPMATERLDADLQGTPTDQMTYSRMIGGLMYLPASRLDIAFATFVCARYQARPTVKHLKEVKRIFRYLRQSYNMGLWYPKDSGFELIAYSDANHARCKDDCKSTSRGLQFLGGKLEHVEKGTVELYFVRTEYQLADLFTKALPKERFEYLVHRIGTDIQKKDKNKAKTDKTEHGTGKGAKRQSQSQKVKVKNSKPRQSKPTCLLAQIARDEEIARQLLALDEERATSEPKTTKDIDWNDPSVQKYWDLKNKPKSEAQARKNMIVYLKNQSNYKMKDFEGMSYDEIRPIFEKVWDFNHNFVPMDLEIEKEKKKPAEFQEIEEEQIEKDTSKKTTGKRKKYLPRRRTRSTAKKQKVEQDDEKEELKNYLDIVPREDVAVDVESLSTKYPIVDWKTYTLSENFMYYKIIRGDGSSKNYKILSEMLYDFDRQDIVELYRLVKERYSSSKPEGYDLMLWGDLHTLFEPDEESEIWMNQNEYNLISWSLCDFCGVHILLMQNGIAIHMLTEKKYPLSQEMISKMLSKRLEVDQESTQAYELLKFIRSQVKK
ncbi:hypothetical protein Tco_1438262 [Tanacetum coccineum]